MYKRLAIGTVLVCFAATPVFAENWGDVIKDLKDLKTDFKDLKTDYANLKTDEAKFDKAVENGNLKAAIKDAEAIKAEKQEIFSNKRDITADIKDLKKDGVTWPKRKH